MDNKLWIFFRLKLEASSLILNYFQFVLFRGKIVSSQMMLELMIEIISSYFISSYKIGSMNGGLIH
jgi:hypothetical protein